MDPYKLGKLDGYIDAMICLQYQKRFGYPVDACIRAVHIEASTVFDPKLLSELVPKDPVTFWNEWKKRHNT